MIYLLIDTNIYLNIAVDRRVNNHNKILDSFIQLLGNNEVKIILPKIVIHETYKHIQGVYMEMHKYIKDVKKATDELYWFNDSISHVNFLVNKKTAQDSVTRIFEESDINKDIHLTYLNDQINTIFSHPNTLEITEDIKHINEATRRIYYKKAPAHKETKNSNADALIVSLLLDVENIVSGFDKLNDVVYFISDNTDDFSEAKKSPILHKHIQDDIDQLGLTKNIKYFINLSILMQSELKTVLANAGITSPLVFSKPTNSLSNSTLDISTFNKLNESDDDYEEDDDDEYNYNCCMSEHMDTMRDNYGLPSLSGINDWISNELFDGNSKIDELIKLLTKLNNLYIEIEDNTLTILNDIEKYLKTNVFLEDKNYINISNIILEKYRVKFKCYEYDDILELLRIKEDELSFDSSYINISDSIYFEDMTDILDKDKNILALRWFTDELESLEDNQTCVINLVLYNAQNGKIMAEGFINIDIGYIMSDINTDKVIEASAASIDVEIDSVISEVTSILNSISEFNKHNCDLLQELYDALGILY